MLKIIAKNWYYLTSHFQTKYISMSMWVYQYQYYCEYKIFNQYKINYINIKTIYVSIYQYHPCEYGDKVK